MIVIHSLLEANINTMKIIFFTLQYFTFYNTDIV